MKKIIIFSSIILSLILLFYLWYIILDNRQRNETAKELIGKYRLNIMKTDLEQYNIDSVRYMQLSLIFYKDHSFKFNMSVPFIYDTIGTWTSTGSDIEEWNNLYYRDGKVFTQFELQVDADSTIVLNNTFSKNGFSGINKIFFLKVK